MIYGYIRVSGHKQDVNNQKLALLDYADANDISIGRIVSETITTRKKLEEREFYELLNELKQGDTLLVWELSRLGRSMFEITRIIETLLEKDVQVIITNKNMALTDSIESKTLIFALSIAAEIERDLISQRTKNGLEKARRSGKKLGRPSGSLSKSKLDPHRNEIEDFLKKGVTKANICKIVGCSAPTLDNFIKTRLQDDVKN